MAYGEDKRTDRLSLPTCAACLQDWQAALPDQRVRPAVRGGAGILGPGLEPGGALLLDDLHQTQGHAGRQRHETINVFQRQRHR